MKNTILVGVLLLVLVACSSSYEPDVMQKESGRAVFSITDAAADMGGVSSVVVEVESIQVHSTTSGWVDVSSDAKTYDLLELKASGENALLADVELDEGTYNQIRLDIGSVVVVDESGSHDASLPSSELKLQGEFEVKANQTASANFDFIADESLHVTGNGEYVLAPVVQVETRSNAQVSITSTSVNILGGEVSTNNRQGMDVEGNVGVNVKIPASAKLDVGLGNKVMLGNSANASANAGVGLGLN